MADDDEMVARLRVEAVDDTGSALRSISENIERTKRTFETLGSGLILGKTFNDFANMQRTLERLQFSANASETQMRGLSKNFEEIARTTGLSIDNIAKGFNTFLDLSGQGLGPAIEQFKAIAEASKVTGVSMEGLGRAAAAAVNDMKVPASEITELVNKWAVELPSTMLQSFTQMAPRLMQTMEAVGMTGKKNAEEIGLAFSEVAKASGSPRAAFMGLNNLLNNMNNTSSQFGKIMLPAMQEVTRSGGDVLDQFEAMYKTMNKMGAFDPRMRPWLQQTLGVDFTTIKTMQTLESHMEEIRKHMREGESAGEAMEAVLKGMNGDARSAIDDLKSSVEGLGASFADFLTTIGANQALKGLADTMRDAAKAADYFKEKTGLKKEADVGSEPGSVFESSTFAPAGAWLDNTGKALMTGGGAVVGGATGGWTGSVAGAAAGRAIANSIIEGRKGELTEKALEEYAKQHGLRGPEHHALGGVVTRPTLSTIGENGPEAIVPLGGSNGHSDDRGANENTQATKDLTNTIRRLIHQMDDNDSRRATGQRLAYTPGAGEMGVPDTAQVYGGSDAGGAFPGMGGSAGRTSGPVFRPGIGPGRGKPTGMPGIGGKVRLGAGDDPRGLADYIRETASKYNVDPETALAVAKSEGLASFSGDNGTSFGAFQLHTHGGLGDEFRKETGLDPSDPKNERATIDWALKNVSRTGWGPYHGARNRYGLGNWAGIGAAGTNVRNGAGITAPAGTPVQHTGMAPVRTASGHSFMVDAKYAENFQGFIHDYEQAGGIIGPNSGTLGARPNASGHPIGAAIDINQVARGRRGGGRSLPPEVEDALAAKWGLVSGNQWRHNDQGHFGISSPQGARDALEHMHKSMQAGGHEHQSMLLEQHRAMRAEMERPIKLAMETPDTVGRRQRMQRIQSRMMTEDMIGTPRYASQLDIGFAALTAIVSTGLLGFLMGGSLWNTVSMLS